ncbi:polyprenyl synthetase family protein [Alphaproteobacteria bacterium]|nr:polyprenyl synthetase family protein [Alphaproteobacteria bacterium]
MKDIEKKSKISGVLDISEILKHSLNKVDEEIKNRLNKSTPLIANIGKHLINASGKRLRPLLTLSMAAQLNDYSMNPIKLAAAVEFIHTATLLHDDVVDESELRRGGKTAHMIWGNEASVLAGDFLFAQSFQLMVETKSLEALSVLAGASCKITEGEFQQMQIANKPDTSRIKYLEVIGKKTAELFGASGQSGAIIANGTIKQQKAAYDYGFNLGLAFQIIDDIMDYLAETNIMGKNIGDDFKLGKTTLPIILAWENSDAREKEFWIKTLQKLEQKELDFENALNIMKKYNVIEQCKNIAKNYIDTSICALEFFPETKFKKPLLDLANQSLNRKK